MLVWGWNYFFGVFDDQLARHITLSDEGKRAFLWKPGLCFFWGIWEERNSMVFRGFIGVLLMFGPL